MSIPTKLFENCNKMPFKTHLYNRDFYSHVIFKYIKGVIMEEALAAVSAIVLLIGCYAGCGRGKKKEKDD